ncbi:MAG: hypothetical protein ACI4TI_02075 [Christensenellales bacterium]
MFDPNKFVPNIEFTYNETFVSLSVETSQDGTIKLVSSNQNFFENKILQKTADEKVEIELNRIGEYKISYQIAIKEQNSLTIIDSELAQTILELKPQTLYNFGYEALYKNYAETDAETKRLNQDYKPLFNNNFKSDFSYLISEKGVDTQSLQVSETISTIAEMVANTLKTDSSLVKKIASTNQAPVKINSFVTENLSGAKYFVLDKNFDYNGSGFNFSTSKRFEENGVYVVVIPYKFENLNSNTYYKVILFNIENSTPKINFYSNLETNTLINANGYTNKTVYVCWEKETENPFSLKNKIRFVKNGEILTEGKDFVVKSDATQNYVEFVADENQNANDGTYLVQLTYGTSEVTIEKQFIIDTSKIEFNVVGVEKNNNSFEIIKKDGMPESVLNNSNETESQDVLKAQTDNNFAIFVKNKKIKSNSISVKYDYIALNSITSEKAYKILDGKVYVYNNFELNQIYTGLTYSNNTINNLESFDKIDIASNNTNAVISISALYKFKIQDLSGNSKTFFILLDNTPNVVLESNADVSIGKDASNNDCLVDSFSTNEATLHEKSDTLSIVSNNYSLVFGDYKAIEFVVNTNNAEFAKDYFGKDYFDTNIKKVDGTFNKADVISENETPVVKRTLLGNYSDEEKNEIEDYLDSKQTIKSGNIFSLTPELDKEVNCIYTLSLNKTTKQFELNTDRNRILIFGNKNDTYSRVFRENPTNADNVYITFVNEVKGDKYDLASLTLTFFPFTEKDGKVCFGESESFDLLARSESGSIDYNGSPSGSFVVNPVVTTYQNGKYVSKEGKYVITKTYVGADIAPVSQTFYVDRKSPISYFSNKSNNLIGNNIQISFDDKQLTAETIYNYILNNNTLTTNMLNFTWTNSDGFDFVFKYDSIPDEDKQSLQIKFALKDMQDNIVFNTKQKLSKGDYKLIIFDNTIANVFANTLTYDDIKYSNYVELTVKIDTKNPQGFYVKDNNESLENKTSTNTNRLSFEFEDSESEFVYNIDLNNIVLKQNGNIIFKTTKTVTSQYFTLDDQKIYYVSEIGNVFGLSRTQIGDSNRYHYTLSILNPSKNSDALFANGISLEASYSLQISFDFDESKYVLEDNGQDFGTNTINIAIDHTAPNKNFSKYLLEDSFLTDDEKETLKNSILNKNISNSINFDNYVFVAKTSPVYAPIGPNNPADVDNEANIDYTDTSNIYIRKYDKFGLDNIQNLQSLVIGDPRYSDQTISRYRFDINTYLGDSLLYSVKKYGMDVENFFAEEGFYEIIEMDEAGNYTIYTVLYAPSLSISAEYNLDDGNTYQTQSNETNLIDAGFSLSKINIQNFDFVNVKVSINENSDNASIFNLRYLPFEANSDNFEYFTSIENLVTRVNQIIANHTTLNEYGNTYKISITNRSGDNLVITNTTPNKEFEIVDYIKNYENSIVLTIPNSQENATWIKELKVYPVLDGKKTDNPLLADSLNKAIPILLEQTGNLVYTFTNSVKYNDDTINVSVYYFEWTDNFNRTQRTVRYLGEKSESKFTFGMSDDGTVAYFVSKNGENYTQYSSGIYFEFNPSLYSIEARYQLLPSTVAEKINIESNISGKLDLFALLKDNSLKNSQIKFNITLTDLTKLDESLPTKLNFSYIYYPLMPKIEFTDSSGNTLSITEEQTISTSKNVHLSYINDTLFKVLSITVNRTITDELDNPITQTFTISGTEHTFSDLGNYIIVVENELGNKKTYSFAITTATNQTYVVMTDEANITNFELKSYGISEEISFTKAGVQSKETFEVYYSIYKTKLIVNTDFKLSYETLTPNDETYSLYLIKQNNEAYKYVAIKKVNYNSNFLKLGEDVEDAFKISTITKDEDISANIKGHTLMSTDGVILDIPLFNSEQNKIVVKIYFNNEQVKLNANIYAQTENRQILTLDNVQSGVYSIYFEDYAGNTQLFSGNSFLNLAILKEVAIKINGEIPVDYQIYNATVRLSIIDERQYISTQTQSLEVKAWLNNKQIEKLTRDADRNYIFSDFGFYKVTITGYVSINSTLQPVVKTIFFTILNANEAIKEFSFVSLNGQNITKITKDGKDVTTELKRVFALSPLYPDEEGNFDANKLQQLVQLYAYSESDFEKTYLYNINLASEILYSTIVPDGEVNTVKIESYLAGGVYEIFVKSQNLILGERIYSFKVWIRDKNAKIRINSSLVEGGETTKEITLSYNPYLIFSQIGECGIYINDTLITKIDNTSVNNVSNYTIPKDAKGTFVVQVKSSSGNTELSFVLNKKEPLSAVSIIVIVLATLIVAGGIFLFIKLRTRMKVK